MARNRHNKKVETEQVQKITRFVTIIPSAYERDVIISKATSSIQLGNGFIRANFGNLGRLTIRAGKSEKLS